MVTDRFARSLAFVVDLLILKAAGHAIGWTIGEQIAPVGGPGRLLGFALAVLYFGLTESALGGGRSPGKRFAEIRVVDAEGKPLPVRRALLRAFVFTLPLFGTGLAFREPGPLTGAAAAIQGILSVGLPAAILLTLVFNVRTRQGTHDLLVGSFVVEDARLGEPIPLRAGRGPAVISGTCLALAAVAVVVGTVLADPEDRVPPTAERMLAELPGSQSWMVSWNRNTLFSSDGAAVTRLITSVTVFYAGTEESPALMRRVAGAILDEGPRFATADVLGVAVARGWDLSIASATRTDTAYLPPAAWRAQAPIEVNEAWNVR